MRIKLPRHLLIVAAAAALSLVGGSFSGVTAQTTSGAGVPGIPGASGSNNATTTIAPGPTSTVPIVAPQTTGVPTTVVPTTAAETKIVPVPPPAPDAPTTSVKPAEPLTPPPGPPPPSLSSGQVAEVLRSQQRSGASSTSALVEALLPLQNLGMGQFPVLGIANWTDDWLDPRAGPPPHQHQGTDVFAAFDTPVRAPVDGILTFIDAGLGGKGAFVTAPDRTYYYMAHLKSFNTDVRSGAAVRQGQVIGYNGDSGNAQGGAPHVHFEVHPGGGAAVNPKPFLDAWVRDAQAKVPALIASFQPKTGEGEAATDQGVPQILVTTGLTRRFSAPFPSVPNWERPTTDDFNRAVLGPLTPAALALLLNP